VDGANGFQSMARHGEMITPIAEIKERMRGEGNGKNPTNI
jgi:hypothetical protein